MKKHFKIVLTVATALALSIGMVGCGEKSSESKLKKIDAFDGLEVTFSGIYPSSTVKITGGVENVTYTPSIEKKVKSGDTVVINAELNSMYSDKYLLKETKKKYTVEGISSYAMEIDEIPEDMQEKMLKQAEDSIKAECSKWSEGNSLKSLDFMGFYFLASKDGFSQNPFNEIYCVYKVTANITGLKRGGDGKEKETGEETYYTHFKYSNIMLLDENTCSVDLSAGQLTANRIESDYGFYNLIATFYTFNGYKDLDSMFNTTITSKIDKYDYETTVK